MEESVGHLGGLDLLVDCASAARVHLDGPAGVPDAEWQDALDINFLAAVRVTSAALPSLTASPGEAAIVNITSSAAKVPQPRMLHYAADVAALAAYSKGLAKTLAPAGIRVNTLTPTHVKTPSGEEVLRTVTAAAHRRDCWRALRAVLPPSAGRALMAVMIEKAMTLLTHRDEGHAYSGECRAWCGYG